LDFPAVIRAVEVISSPPLTRHCNLLAGLYLLFEEELVWLAAWEADLPDGEWPQLSGHDPVTLEVPGKYTFATGWEIIVESVPFPESNYPHVMHNEDPYRAWLDPAGISFPLTLRPRQAGDRFSPLGIGDNSLKLPIL
jgi:hypothetical protein